MLFTNSSYLVHVDLSNNLLLAVNDLFVDTFHFNYHALTSIDLSWNCLKDIPFGLLELDVQAEIDLSGNKISFQSIRQVLQKLANAKTPNGYRGFSLDNFRSEPKTLILHDNSFTSFDISTLDTDLSKAFGIFFVSVRLNFGDFVFNCDCKMYSLYKLIHQFGYVIHKHHATLDYMYSTVEYNSDGFNCLRPEELRGKPLIHAPVLAFGCEKELPTCPENCKCWIRSVDGAVKVDCANQNLTSIPASIPNGSIELDVSNNEVISLQQDVPHYVQLLQVLDLSENHLQNVNEKIFKARYNLSDLRLHNNELTTLPKTVSVIQQMKVYPLQCRHNETDGVSNHQPHHCLINRLFRRRSKKISKLRVTGLCVGNSSGTCKFPAQMASNAENFSIWWRHHGKTLRAELPWWNTKCSRISYHSSTVKWLRYLIFV